MNASKKRKKSVTKRQNNKRRNILISVIGLLFLACVIIFFAVNVSSSSIEEKLLERAALESSNISEEEINSVSLSETSFEINGKSYFYFKNIKEEGDPIRELSVEIPKRLNTHFKRSKDLVQNFVKEYFESTTAKEILNEMKKIQLVVGDFSSSLTLQNASFAYENDKIYVNPDIVTFLEYYPDDILIFTLVHEWIHMVKNVTGDGNTQYIYTVFNEAMTDIIAQSIYFCNREDGNGYGDFYPYALLFIDTFKEDALDYYFFGYDSLFKTGKLTEERMEIFCFLVEMSDCRVQADGLSHQKAYEMMTGLTLTDSQKFAKGLLQMSSQ